MTNRKSEAATEATVAAAGEASHDAQTQSYCTPTTQGRQASADPLAVYHLAQLLAGATDVDLDALRLTFPDIPLNGDEPDRVALWDWLTARSRLACAVLEVDLAAPPRGTPRTCWTADELLAAEFLEPPDWFLDKQYRYREVV